MTKGSCHEVPTSSVQLVLGWLMETMLETCKHHTQDLDVQVLGILMHIASLGPIASKHAANSTDSENQQVLIDTLSTVLGPDTQVSNQGLFGSQSMGTKEKKMKSSQESISVRKKPEHAGLQSAGERPRGQDPGLCTMCFAIVKSLTEYSMAWSDCSEIEQQQPDQQFPSNSIHAPGKAFDTGSCSDATAPKLIWDVVQCLLLDFLCSILRLHGSKCLGALIPSIKLFCQQHARHSVPSTRMSDCARSHVYGCLSEGACHSSPVSWVLNVRSPPLHACDRCTCSDTSCIER